MLTLLFVFTMFIVFGKILGLALKASWGLAKIIFGVILLPFMLVALVLSGLIMIAFPILIVIGIATFIVSKVL